MGATDNGRNLAPRTASALELGLTADCTELEIDNYGNLFATRPTYGGKMIATISSKTKPNFATIRVGTFNLSDFRQTKTRTSSIDIENNNTSSPIEVLETYIKDDNNDLTYSDIIIAGGLGLKTKENFAMIYKLAELLNAKPAASRAAVEQNWADKSIQIGQTGIIASPKLYIAFGISGAMQHIVGINNSDKIIAINIDESAPIMKLADVAIKEDAINLLKVLTEKLEQNN